MPHQHHHRHIHRLHEKRGLWNDFTAGVGSAWNDAFPTQAKANGQSTSTRTVVMTITGTPTASPDDSGDEIPAPTVTQQVTVQVTTADPVTVLVTASPTPTPSTTPSTSSTPSSTSLPSSLVPSSSESIQSTLVLATNTPTQLAQTNAQLTTAASAAQASSTSSTDSSGTSGDTNTAAKAGIAIGVLGGILVVFLAVYFLVARRKKQLRDRLDDDEKTNGPFGDKHAIAPLAVASATPVAAKRTSRVPRLSLRPVTQFLPNLNPHPTQHTGPSQYPDRRASRGAAIAMMSTPPMSQANNMPQQQRAMPGASAWERPLTSASNNSANPFGSGAERIQTPNGEARAISPVSPLTPIDGEAGFQSHAQSGGPTVGSAAAASTGLTRKASLRKDTEAPRPLDLTKTSPVLAAVPPSPAGTEFSMHSLAPGQAPGPSGSAAAIAAAGGPQQSTVHRVQLDFKPTLEDEMELRAGQLVRLLHEYDDGWALCIRLDRSQQGVVPRTCLSTRPVKPRPAQGGQRMGPPVNPNRGPGYSPNGPGPNRPMTPQGRPMTPQGHRPMSPAGGMRPQSPDPQYQQQQGRPQSPNGMSRRNSPPGPSPMNQGYRPGPPPGQPMMGRKPVPGQAY